MTHNNFFHSFGCRRFLLALLRFRSCSSRAATGIAGGGRREATAGRRAAAAAEAAADSWKSEKPRGLLSVNGRSRGGEYVLYASSGASRLGSATVRCTIGLKATRLGWVSTGTGGGTAEGAGVAGGGLAGGGGVVGGDSEAGAMMRPVLSLPWNHGEMVEKLGRSGCRVESSSAINALLLAWQSWQSWRTPSYLLSFGGNFLIIRVKSSTSSARLR